MLIDYRIESTQHIMRYDKQKLLLLQTFPTLKKNCFAELFFFNFYSQQPLFFGVNHMVISLCLS